MVTIDGLTLDAALTEQHAISVELTQHPVEKGSDPTDHARTKPRVYVVEGFITSAPLSKDAQRERGNTLVRTSTGAVVPFFPDFYREAYARLMDLATSHRLVTVSTELENYTDMMLRELVIPRDAATGYALQFKATFEKIRVVDVALARLEAQQTKRTGVPEKPTGKTEQSKKPPEEASEERASIAKGLLDATGLTKSGSGRNPSNAP